ncbi:MAG: hypothetical protein SWO11_06200 [Thermodesulfobacteriota bacterium]|nr:hypothetical protein [Thermodesulfobacteriota bacterium]
MPVHSIGYQDRVVAHEGIAKTLSDKLKTPPYNLLFDLRMPFETKCYQIDRTFLPYCLSQ